MAQTFDDVTLTTTWADLCASNSSLISVPVEVQNKGPGLMLIYWGGASQPTGTNGRILARLEPDSGTANHIWVRAVTAENVAASVSIEDY